MGKGNLFFMALCMLPLLNSCKGRQDEQRLLESIEQTWQQCETALSEARMQAEVLKDSVQNSSEYVRQKYNLLTIRLRDKNDEIPASPDSATKVLAYFAGRKNAVDKERACYYLGSTYRDLKDYPRAVNCFLEAVEVARQGKGSDTLVWQNALSQLRNLYMLQLDYEEELSAGLQTVEQARQSGQKLGWHLMDVATAYEHLDDTLQCLQYCNQAYQVYQEEGFPQKYGSSYAYMLAVYAKYGHYAKVEALLQHLLQLPEDRRPENYELCLARFHEKVAHTDSALLHYKAYYDHTGSLSGRYEASAGLQRCHLLKGDYPQAALWGCRLNETNDSIIAQRAFAETQRARDAYLYYRDKEAEQAIVLRDERIILMSTVAGLALLCLVSGLAAFYSFRKKKFMEEMVGKDKLLRSVKEEIQRRQEELELKQQEIEQLGRQLDEAEQTIAASKRQMEDAMKELEQRTMVNRELTRIALMNNAAGKAENVIAYFRKVASGKSVLKDAAWEDLMTAIETLYPGFLEKVQVRLKRQLREPLLHTICLLKIGLKPAQIAKVMDAKIQTVWNRVKRAEEICGDLLFVSFPPIGQR